MVFIKGAWVEPSAREFCREEFHKYFCCPGRYLTRMAHRETYDPRTGKGERHDPQVWFTCHCERSNLREIPTTGDNYGNYAITRPEWCPLRSPV